MLGIAAAHRHIVGRGEDVAHRDGIGSRHVGKGVAHVQAAARGWQREALRDPHIGLAIARLESGAPHQTTISNATALSVPLARSMTPPTSLRKVIVTVSGAV